jgi:hypothetical protein
MDSTDQPVAPEAIDERVPWLRVAWDHLPSPFRRVIVRAMRSERIRSNFLSLAGIRDKDAFIGLSKGGDVAVAAALRHLQEHGIAGDYYEFGVFRGYLFHFAQQAADELQLESMRFFGFDSFQGLPEIEGNDRTAGIFISGDYRTEKDRVQAFLSDRGYDWNRGSLIEGFFDQSLTDETKQRLHMGPAALVMIDCDLYQSTVPVLEFVSDRLQDGTVVLFDDWYCFGGDQDKGELRAFGEFLAAHPEWRATAHTEFGRFGKGFVMQRAAP